MTKQSNNPVTSQVISMDKLYKTREGRSVRILCTDRQDPMFPVVALVTTRSGEGVFCYDNYGEFDDEDISEFDLIEYQPFAEFKEGDKVMVRDHDEEHWFPRFFKQTIKHYDQVFPCTYEKDYNPWSNVHDNRPVRWVECRFPTEEELNGSK